MIVLLIGTVLVMIGALSIRFPDLVESLRVNDHHQWEVLGSPPNYAFSKSIGVFSWILDHGYEKTQSEEVLSLGKKALHKALFAKHSLLIGSALIFIGFVNALVTG